ncbi:hypothetical protein JCM10207_000153 [Rhodosporidiobolus poonsookiae]
MAAFTRAFPALARAAAPSLAVPHLLPSAPSASTRLFSSSARAFARPSRVAHAPFAPTRAAQSPFARAREAFRRPNAFGQQGQQQKGGQRGVASVTEAYGGGKQSVDWRKVGINVGIGAAGAVALNVFLNRDPSSPLAGFEGQYLRETFGWTAGGLGITAAVAYLAHQNGLAIRLMTANPWAVMAGGVALSIGSMMGVYYTAPDSPLHYVSWAAFSAMQGLTLSPMFFLSPAILGRAGLYTLGAVGGISYVGATAQSDKYLWLGGPLLAGLGVLICANLAPMLMPRMALRTLTTLETVSAYGGVAVFSGMILYDTNKVRRHAQLAQRGVLPADPVRESVSLVLDVINLFTSIVRVLLLQQGNRRR